MTKEPRTPRPAAVSDESRPEIDRRGRRAIGATVTAGVLALVVLLNILFSFAADRYMWQLDSSVTRYTVQTDVSLYTPSETYIEWIRKEVVPMVDQLNGERTARGEEPLTVNIKFCAERDEIYASDAMRLLQYSAMALQKEFPDHIKVSYINVEQNPSAVQQYKATSASRIYPYQIIFEFGTEYRVRSYDTFFLKTSETSTDYWAYNGEQKITSILLGLTRAVSPVAAFITNHGEDVKSISAFRSLIEKSGYEVVDIDLSRDPIPENCRLLISYDPQTDFMGLGNSAYAGTSTDQSEIDKLDDFLNESCSFMLFVDKDTPKLTVLEEYMEEWGVTIARGELADGTVGNYTVRDQSQKLDKDGYTPIADYVTTGMGGTITSPLRKVSYPAKVVFPNATSISMSGTYFTTFVEADTSTGTPAYSYGRYYRNGVSRYMQDVFRGSMNAVAEVGGETYEISTSVKRFRFMTLSAETRSIQETDYLTTSDPSYVAVFSSTEFAANALLESAAYGNADVLSATLLTMGHEVEPANLEFKAFKVFEMDTTTYKPDVNGMMVTTAILTALPIVICITVGVVVSIKRKYR